MSTFTELVRKRRQSGGTIGGSLSYGVKERLKEKFDPRRIFNQSGLLAALFPQLKAYKSGSSSDSKNLVKKLSTLEPSTSLSQPILESIQNNSKIAAKNSMVLPAMHRDINVMRQNIIKLVKLKGGQATNKADAWFMNSRTMENAYENKFKSSTAPKKEETKSDVKENETGLLGTIGTIANKAINTITNVAEKVVENLPLIGAAAGTGAGLASRAAGLLLSPQALAATAVGVGVYSTLPDDVKKTDPLESGDYTLQKPFKEKSWYERLLIGKRRTAIQDYINTVIDMKLGPVFNNKQAYDILQFWDIDVPPELIAKEGQELKKATNVVPEDRKVKAKTFEDFKQSAENTFMNRSEQIGPSQPKSPTDGQPNPRAFVNTIGESLSGPEQVPAKDPFAYKGVTPDKDTKLKIETFVENNRKARLEASTETASKMMSDAEARTRAEQIFGVSKDVGSKIIDAYEKVEQAKIDSVKEPSVKIIKETNNSSQPNSLTDDVVIASVYDNNFLSLLGAGRG